MKKVRVKIWGNPLKCPICQQDIFHFRKVQIVDPEKPGSFELCYLFECAHCGHDVLFGGDKVAENEAALSHANQPVLHRVQTAM